MPWTCSEAVSSTERHTRDTDSSTMTDSEMSSLRTPMGRLTGSQERQEASRGCWATAHSRRCGRGMLRGDGAGGQGSPQGTRPGPLFLRTVSFPPPHRPSPSPHRSLHCLSALPPSATSHPNPHQPRTRAPQPGHHKTTPNRDGPAPRSATLPQRTETHSSSSVPAAPPPPCSPRAP